MNNEGGEENNQISGENNPENNGQINEQVANQRNQMAGNVFTVVEWLRFIFYSILKDFKFLIFSGIVVGGLILYMIWQNVRQEFDKLMDEMGQKDTSVL